MNAYSQALDGQGTTMLLSPDSEFFRYFRDAGGNQAPAAPGGTSAPAASAQ
jgi:membrane protease subunit HflC